MKFNISLLSAIIYLLCTSSTCNPPGVERAFTIRIQNNTNHVIEFVTSYNYPDTTIPDTQEKLSGVSPNGYTPIDSKEDWDKVLANAPGGKISFFFFSPDTINKYGWEKVRLSNNIMARKDLSIADLKAANYVVTYP